MNGNGRWLSIGVGVASWSYYGRRLRALPAAPLDARLFARHAESRGFAVTTLIDEQAWTENVRSAIRRAAAELRSGDRFVISFSGHGYASTTPQGFQQSWYLFDEPFVRFGPNGLDALLAAFAPGVRIALLPNCCHAARGPERAIETPQIQADVLRIASSGVGERTIASVDESQPSAFVARVLEELEAGGDFSGFAEVELQIGNCNSRSSSSSPPTFFASYNRASHSASSVAIVDADPDVASPVVIDAVTT